MTTLVRRQAFFLSTFALTALLLALPVVPASATTSGIDTPPGVASLPLAVEGTAVMTLTPGVATVDGVINLGTAGSCGIMGLGFGASLGACGAFPALMADGSNDLLFNVPTGASYSFRINNASAPDALHISSTGNVGIGITTPAEPLDINGIARTNAQFISTAGGAEFRGVAGNYGWMNYSDGSNFYFLLTSSGNQYGTYNSLRPYNINLATGAMSIGNSLAVANGLTADNAAITGNETVGGTVTVNGATLTNSTINVANALLTPTCGSNEALTENSNHTFACVTIANLAQIGPTVVPNCAGMSPAQALTWNGSGFSCVATSVTPPASLWTALSGNVYNTSLTGNVGIGLTGPQAPLDVNGEVASNLTNFSQFRAVAGNYGAMIRNDGSNTYILHTASGSPYGGWNNDRQIILPDNSDNVYLSNNGGKVGIGLTNPATPLDIASGFFNGLRLDNGSNAFSIFNDGNAHIESTAGSTLWLNGDINAPVDINNGGGPTYINPNGNNVGINTTTPQTTLDVNGPVRPGTAVAGAACPQGAIAHDSNGNLLTCGSTSVWGAATGGTSAWVTVACTGMDLFVNNYGEGCNTSLSPLQICQNAGYSSYAGPCQANFAAPNTSLVQGSVGAFGSPGSWTTTCMSNTVIGFEQATNLQILCR